MNRTALSLISGSAVATATAATVLVALPSGAGAAAGCTAWASMPATLHTHVSAPATLHMTLRATAGCRGTTVDNGATAYLVGPAGTQPVYQRWTRIGDTQTADFYTTLDQPGTYRVVQGDLQTYDAEFEHIPAQWRTTSVRVSPAPKHKHKHEHKAAKHTSRA